MTRLDRILSLLKGYDGLLENVLISAGSGPGTLGWIFLDELRKEKDQLTQELIEHGCRRKY